MDEATIKSMAAELYSPMKALSPVFFRHEK